MKKRIIFATAIGEMAEWSNAAVLKTVEGHTSGGSNPSFSAETLIGSMFIRVLFFCYRNTSLNSLMISKYSNQKLLIKTLNFLNLYE